MDLLIIDKGYGEESLGIRINNYSEMFNLWLSTNGNIFRPISENKKAIKIMKEYKLDIGLFKYGYRAPENYFNYRKLGRIID